MALLPKIKNKLTGLKKKVRTKRKQNGPPAVTDNFKKESFGAGEVRVEHAKFYTPHFPDPAQQAALRVAREELSPGYGLDKIVLQVRDPWWLYAYWEVQAHTMDRIKHQLGDIFHRAKRVLRVYDVSYIIFDGNNAHRFFDVDLRDDSSSWYIDTGAPGRSWCVDLGFLLPDGRFITIVRSNTVQTPLAGPSWISDEEWMIPDEMFGRLYGLGVGFGSSPLKIKGLWEKRLKSDVTSGIPSSMSSPVKKAKERGFWLVVNTELIVYGATEPDAKVCVQGKQIQLRPDGTFSLRFALPDGKQAIPVEAESSDNLEKRKITPIVTRKTK